MKSTIGILLTVMVLVLCVNHLHAEPLQFSTPVVAGTDMRWMSDLVAGPDGSFHCLLTSADDTGYYYFKGNAAEQHLEPIPVFTDLQSGYTRPCLSMWNEHPMVFVKPSDTSNILYSTRNETWSAPIEIPDTQNVDAFSVLTTSSGIIHIYSAKSNSGSETEIEYRSGSGSDWQTESVFIGSYSGHVHGISRLTIDTSGLIHFFYDLDPDYLFHCTRIGSNQFEFNYIDGPGFYAQSMKSDLLDTNTSVLLYLTIHEHYCDIYLAQINHHVVNQSNIYDATVITDIDFTFAGDDFSGEPRQYIFMSSGSEISYFRKSSETWMHEIIPGCQNLNHCTQIHADWNPSANSIGIIIFEIQSKEVSFLTAEPISPTPTPTPEPCSSLTCEIAMPSNYFVPGDLCNCVATICNPGPGILEDMRLMLIIDVYGELYFGSDLGNFGWFDVTVPVGWTNRTLIPDFIWPYGAGSADDVHLWVGLCDDSMTQLIGEIAMLTFGWGI